MITFLVGDSYKPLFATVTGRGPHTTYNQNSQLKAASKVSPIFTKKTALEAVFEAFSVHQVLTKQYQL